MPKYTECGQLCGPVYDRCTGRTLQCGGCTASGKVCNLVTHECVTPLTTCIQLGAECGELRNTCGLFVDCGTCPAGKICNAGTHRCEACPAKLKCADLGFECGDVWLGCGAKTSTTNCGSCPASETCNTTLHVCEPRCTPAPKAEICAARGAECDPVSDGCGGMVNCGGCPTGQQCGISGLGNRCSAPPPSVNCISFGYECLLPGEKLTTACGETVSCGTCPSGQVCRANHKCGPPCTPKKCDVARVHRQVRAAARRRLRRQADELQLRRWRGVLDQRRRRRRHLPGDQDLRELCRQRRGGGQVQRAGCCVQGLPQGGRHLPRLPVPRQQRAGQE
ncbi:MAG: hypothetical protein IPG96_16120 [Proteobacteria bacterium]|nr:hypothetical protein [Pseudomonadota bacterium]